MRSRRESVGHAARTASRLDAPPLMLLAGALCFARRAATSANVLGGSVLRHVQHGARYHTHAPLLTGSRSRSALEVVVGQDRQAVQALRVARGPRGVGIRRMRLFPRPRTRNQLQRTRSGLSLESPRAGLRLLSIRGQEEVDVELAPHTQIFSTASPWSGLQPHAAPHRAGTWPDSDR